MATIKSIELPSISKPCDDCAERVREAVAGVSGVTVTAVSSWESARVVVQAESGTSQQAVAEALRAAGYSVAAKPKGVRTWGAVAGILGGVAFAAGHLVGFAGGGRQAAAAVSGWLNLLGVVALVFAVLGVHESLDDRGGVPGGAGAMVTMLGFILLAGIDTLGIALAYELIPQAAREAAPIVAISAVANVSLMVGLLLLSLQLLRTGAVPRFVGVLFGLAVLAFLPGYFGVTIGGPLGALFLGAGFAGAAPQLWSRS